MGVGKDATTPHSPLPTPYSLLPTPSLRGGFDVVLGNPPWERIKLQEKEWFAVRRPDIANAANAAQRQKKIAALREEDPALYDAFMEDRRQAEGESHLVRNGGRFPLCGRGDVNTYAIFAETMRTILAPTGRAGIIVPSGIATDDTTKFFFQDLTERGSLASLYDFENRKGLFPDVDSRMKFCALTMNGAKRKTNSAEFVFFAHGTDDLNEAERRFTLSADDIELLNPNTFTCATFRSKRDAELTKGIYRRVPVLIREGARGKEGNREWGIGNSVSTPNSLLSTPSPTPFSNPWGVTFMAMFHMSNDSGLFRSAAEVVAEKNIAGDGEKNYGNGEVVAGNGKKNFEAEALEFEEYSSVAGDGEKNFEENLSGDEEKLSGEGFLPLYEAKMLHHFDHRWATYRGNGEWGVGSGDTTPDALLPTPSDKQKPHFTVTPRYYVEADEVQERLTRRDNKEFGKDGKKKIVWQWQREWLLGFRDITNTTNERTVIASLLPRVGVGNNLPLLFLSSDSPIAAACLAANLSAFALDFVARHSVGGTHLNFFIFKQLPVLPPETYTEGSGELGVGNSDTTPHSLLPIPFIAPRVLELVYTARDMTPFARDCGYDGEPFRWNDERRFLLRCELDAAYFHLYGIGREDAAYIMETFPIVKRKDEEKFGEYRTSRVILEIYDAMREAIETGAAYQTRLDPLPANGYTVPADLLRDFAAAPTAPRPLKANSPADNADFRLTPPAAPHPALDFDTGEAEMDAAIRVKVNDRPGTLIAETPDGERTQLFVLFDGESKPRKFHSPPAKLEREIN